MMRRLLFVFFVVQSTSIWAQEKPLNISAKGPIHCIQSEKICVATDNVQVQQDNLTLDADYVKLSYTGDKKKTLQELHAKRNVRFRLSAGTIYTDSAFYNVSKKRITLTGRPSLAYLKEWKVYSFTPLIYNESENYIFGSNIFFVHAREQTVIHAQTGKLFLQGNATLKSRNLQKRQLDHALLGSALFAKKDMILRADQVRLQSKKHPLYLTGNVLCLKEGSLVRASRAIVYPDHRVTLEREKNPSRLTTLLMLPSKQVKQFLHERERDDF